MSKTIQELTTQIEELEKRIKIISSSQSSLSQIMAIRDCIDQIKTYLEDLNTTLDNIESSASDAELEALKARVSICEEDISTLQTDLGSCQDDITDIESEISAINSSIGEQNTTITNLQTTQTNLQTTQSSQASTINNINSRLTTAENNISTLTGGVDVGAIESRISALEPLNPIWQNYAHKRYNCHNATPNNYTLYTREVLYTCKQNTFVFQEFKIEYESTGSGILTMEVFSERKSTGEIYTIDLAANPNGCTIIRKIFPNTRANNLHLKFVADGEITYKTLDITMHGTELYIFDTEQDLKVVCFEGNIYITRMYDDCVRYGKFSQADIIDIDNLPNSRPYNDAHGWHNYMIYAPFPTCPDPFTEFIEIRDETIVKVCSDNNTVYCHYDSQSLDDASYYMYCTETGMSNDIFFGLYAYGFMPTIVRGKINIYSINARNSTYTFNKLSVASVSNWLFCNMINTNYQSMSTPTIQTKDMAVVAFGDDGYFYLVQNRTGTYTCQICKGGLYATAYRQQDGSINVYVSFANHIDLYNITQDENEKLTICNYVKTIEDCTCIYELFNDVIIKKTTSGWILEEPTTIAPEETSE